MPQLLEKLNNKQLLWILSGVLALGVVLLILLLCLKPERQPPVTEATELAITEPSFLEVNPFRPEDFVTDDQGFVHCLTADCRLGIDVSGFQGQINWEQVRSAGVEFVFIRVGGRGTSQGSLYTDDYAQQYYQGAKKAGLAVGAYFFSQSITPAEAQEEAMFVLKQIQDWDLDLPVVYDWEWVSDTARTADLSGFQLTHCTEAFCQIIKNAGLTPMVYFNYSQGMQMLNLNRLSKYPLWLALYHPYPDFPYRVDYWQYSCTGRIPGIEVDVDLNLFMTAPTENLS